MVKTYFFVWCLLSLSANLFARGKSMLLEKKGNQVHFMGKHSNRARALKREQEKSSKKYHQQKNQPVTCKQVTTAALVVGTVVASCYMHFYMLSKYVQEKK